jgi:hypothetical protein
MGVYVVRAFVKQRELLVSNKELAQADSMSSRHAWRKSSPHTMRRSLPSPPPL